MAANTNIFQKGKKFASTALGLLRRTVTLPALFTTRYGIDDFKGAEDDVINVRRPPVLRARDKGWRTNNAIVVDRLVKSKIQIKLNQHPYSAVALSSEEKTLDEVSYVRDIQAPQVAAMLDYFVTAIVKALRTAEFVLEVAFTPGGSGRFSDPRKVALRARKLFADKHVPTGQRYWLVGSTVSEELAGYDKLLDVNTAGLPEALRDGVVGKLGGFVIIEIDALEETESYFVHGTAVALATVAPEVPDGAAKGGGVAAGNGLAVTQVWDYDGDHMVDRSVVHAFVGATPVTDPEVDDDDMIIVDEEGEIQEEFVRAIRVNFNGSFIDPDGEIDTDDGGNVWTLQVTGAPTGGTFTLTADGEATDPIAHNASNKVIADALNALQGVSGAKVTGTGTKTITFTEYVDLGRTTALTGGTSPNVTLTEVS